jgi:hypothetical protein
VFLCQVHSAKAVLPQLQFSALAHIKTNLSYMACIYGMCCITHHVQVDMFLANLHVTMSKGRHGDVFRQICGAGVAAKQSDFYYDNDSSSDEDAAATNDKVKLTFMDLYIQSFT